MRADKSGSMLGFVRVGAPDFAPPSARSAVLSQVSGAVRIPPSPLVVIGQEVTRKEFGLQSVNRSVPYARQESARKPRLHVVRGLQRYVFFDSLANHVGGSILRALRTSAWARRSRLPKQITHGPLAAGTSAHNSWASPESETRIQPSTRWPINARLQSRSSSTMASGGGRAS
jgi:hypothetical protein